jgi:hypothetical protein
VVSVVLSAGLPWLCEIDIATLKFYDSRVVSRRSASKPRGIMND